MGVIDDISRNKIINASNLVGKYENELERDSAFEELNELIKEKIRLEEEENKKIQEEKEKIKKENTEKVRKIEEDKRNPKIDYFKFK